MPKQPSAGGVDSPPASTCPIPRGMSGPRDGARRRPRWRLALFLVAADALARAMEAAAVLRAARCGPWRVEVAEGSMAPTLVPGDWLLVDPTCRRWPRPGSIVVIREPGTDILAIKRLAARGRDARAANGTPALAPREAQVLGDARERSVDSRTYGPLDEEHLVARAWFRYGPARRIGPLRAPRR
jgi:hypothetical protein